MTASHNPAAYNGYKAYGPDGCQITSEAAKAISASIANTDAFSGVKTMGFDEAVASGMVKWIDDAVLERYYDCGFVQVGEQPFRRAGRRSSLETRVHTAQWHGPDSRDHRARARGHHRYHGSS